MVRFRILVVMTLLFLTTLAALAQEAPHAVAQRFFTSVAGGDYGTSWGLLTQATQNYLIDAVAKESQLPPQQIQQLFENNAPEICGGFWTSFRNSSHSDEIVKVATYKTDRIQGNLAIVDLILGDRNLKLTMKNENGWKLGYFETFLQQQAPTQP